MIFTERPVGRAPWARSSPAGRSDPEYETISLCYYSVASGSAWPSHPIGHKASERKDEADRS
jgi:hypothetical protein